MKLSLSFFLASVAAVASASLRGNSDGLDMARIFADRRNLQDGDSGGCYDMTVHQCGCGDDRCSKAKCDDFGGIWTAECPNHCTECGDDGADSNFGFMDSNMEAGAADGNYSPIVMEDGADSNFGFMEADSNMEASEGTMVENEDGSVTMADESGSLTMGEDGIVLTDTESGITITISDEGIFMTDAEGTKTDISEAVVYNEALDIYTLDDGEGNSISFNEDGFMITGEDGSFVGADESGIIMGDGEDGIMMGNEEGMIAADGDGMTISDEAGNTITATEDGITITTAEGEVITIDEDGVNLIMEDGTVVDISPFVAYDEATGTYTLADEEGNSISFNEEGFMVVGEDGSFIGANEDGISMGDESGVMAIGEEGTFAMDEDGIVMTDNEGGMFAAGEDGIVISGPDGTITISEDGVFLTDAEGNTMDITDAVDYDEEEDVYSLADEDGNVIYFNEGGFLIVGEDGSFMGADESGISMGDEDGIMATGDEGTFMADEDGFVMTDNEGGMVAANEDGIMISGPDGTITISEEGVFLTDAEGTTTDISDAVEYNEEEDYYSLTDEEGNSVMFNEDGFLVTGEDGSFIGAGEDGIIAGNEDGEVMAVGEDGITTGSMEDFMDIEDTATDENGDCMNIPDIVCANNNYSILCSLLEANTGLFSILSEEYTLFAPTDAAFAAVAGPLETLDEETVQDILLFHLVDGAVKSTDMECGGLVTMVSGYSSRHACKRDADRKPIVVQKGGGNRKNNLLPKIISADVAACDGIIHAVDNVLLPNYIGVF